jgi:hypothetical protein
MNSQVAVAINRYCPHSGKPVAGDSLTTYRGLTVGFCNPSRLTCIISMS